MIEQMKNIDQQDFTDLEFIVSETAPKQMDERMKKFKRIAEIYQKDTLDILENNLRQSVEKGIGHSGECGTIDEMEDQLWSFVTGIRNIYKIFVGLMSEENYIGLMTQTNVKDICSNLSNKIESQWTNFSRSILRAQTQEQGTLKLIYENCNQQDPDISLKANCILQKWLLQNFSHPYPCPQIKSQLAKKASLNIHQVNNWFTNARERGLKRLRKCKIQKTDTDQEENI